MSQWMRQSFLNAQIAVLEGRIGYPLRASSHLDMLYPSLARRVTRRRFCLSNLVSLVQQPKDKSEIEVCSKRPLSPKQRKRCMCLICGICMNLWQWMTCVNEVLQPFNLTFFVFASGFCQGTPWKQMKWQARLSKIFLQQTANGWSSYLVSEWQVTEGSIQNHVFDFKKTCRKIALAWSWCPWCPWFPWFPLTSATCRNHPNAAQRVSRWRVRQPSPRTMRSAHGGTRRQRMHESWLRSSVGWESEININSEHAIDARGGKWSYFIMMTSGTQLKWYDWTIFGPKASAETPQHGLNLQFSALLRS